ncbi:MAG: DUF2752 domain-containing protein [Gemmataceae bacterium]|nr:DUF2752 domain-containing protein [Gemmataceae bacterium]
MHTNQPTGEPLPVAGPVTRPRATWYVRATLLAVGVVLVGVFGTAAYLNPYEPDGTPRRMATHTQLGLPECNFVSMTGKPCPSCGMTTSFALLAHGDVRGSLNANWAGTVLAVAWAGLLVWSVASGIAGRPLLIPPGRGELVLTVYVGVMLVLMLGRWVGVLVS